MRGIVSDASQCCHQGRILRLVPRVDQVCETPGSVCDVVHLVFVQGQVCDENVPCIHVFNLADDEYSIDLQILPERIPVLFDKPAELVTVDPVVVGSRTAICSETSTMEPLSPKAWQAQHLPRRDDFRLQVAELPGNIAHTALIQKVNLRAFRPGHESIISRGGDMLDHCEVANLPVDQEIILVSPALPDTQGRKRSHEHLFVKHDLQMFRNILQKLDISLLQADIIHSLSSQNIIDLRISVGRKVPVVEEAHQR
mmetsp:Transcript_67554/g.158518  ORF Transcript_67554/g.158518 Transcript_67554/m.158518 type:complete len:255 (+) Transcript_67554:222-986(+)